MRPFARPATPLRDRPKRPRRARGWHPAAQSRKHAALEKAAMQPGWQAHQVTPQCSRHGARFRPEIGTAVAELKSVPGESGYRRAAALALTAWSDIQAQAPTAAAELGGIAAGARLAVIDALQLSGFEFFDRPSQIARRLILEEPFVSAAIDRLF